MLINLLTFNDYLKGALDTDSMGCIAGKASALGTSLSSCLVCRFGVPDHVGSAFSRSNAHLPFGTANRVQCAMAA